MIDLFETHSSGTVSLSCSSLSAEMETLNFEIFLKIKVWDFTYIQQLIES